MSNEAWKDKAILEIELTNEVTGIRFPAQIKIIQEVTNDAASISNIVNIVKARKKK